MNLSDRYKKWKSTFKEEHSMLSIDDIVTSPESHYNKNAIIEGTIRQKKGDGNKSYLILESAKGSSLVGYVNDNNYPDAALLAEGDCVAVSGYYHRHDSVDDFHITNMFNYSLQEKINGEKNG